jgi:hypothetical protein
MDYDLTKNETEKCRHFQEKNYFLRHLPELDLPNAAKRSQPPQPPKSCRIFPGLEKNSKFTKILLYMLQCMENARKKNCVD